MGSLNGRVQRLEGRAADVLRDRHEEERQRRSRAIMRMILDELASLRRSGADGSPELLEQAIRRVVEDQYEDFAEESRQAIADSWIETLHSWTRLDWQTNAGRDGPPA